MSDLVLSLHFRALSAKSSWCGASRKQTLAAGEFTGPPPQSQPCMRLSTYAGRKRTIFAFSSIPSIRIE